MPGKEFRAFSTIATFKKAQLAAESSPGKQVTSSTISRIGKYDVVGILGRGGMGVVYLANDKRIGREVAIKTLTEGYSGNPEMLERFYREAQAGVLQHPNIVIVYDLGDQDGIPYIVMEYIKGDSLEKIIPRTPPLSIMEKLDIMAQVCNALDYAHRRGVIHRDIKPGNVMVQPDGTVKLVDFGIARQERPGFGAKKNPLTRKGNVIGSINYIAPERFKDELVDGRSDIFSSGVLLYQLLTGGVLPFDAGDDAATAHKIVNSPHPSLGQYLTKYPPELDGILDRMLAKSPSDRYPSAAELQADLVALRDSLKEQRIQELHKQAEALCDKSEFNRARDILLQVLKVDSHNTAAKALLGEVQQNLARQQRAEQVRQLRLQAQDAMEQKLYPEAIRALQQAVNLEPGNAELASLLSHATETLRRKEQLEVLVREAESARYAGDLDLALKVVERARSLDANDTHLKAIHARIAREAAEAARQKKTRELVESARQEISARQFTRAFELLRQVEEIDSNLPELHALTKLAQAGKDQEHRRKELERINSEFDQAFSREDYDAALAIASEGLKLFPADAAILKLHSLAEKQVQEQQQKTFVEEQVQLARNLLQQGDAQAALGTVERALGHFPHDARLLSLKTIVRESIELQRAESAHSEHLQQAREALDRRDYVRAAELLALIVDRGVVSKEITDLLEFARTEAANQERQRRLNAALAEGQRMLEAGHYTRAIEVLGPVAQRDQDQAVLLLLEDAREKYSQLEKSAHTALSHIEQLVNSGSLDQARKLFGPQLGRFTQVPGFKEELEKLNERITQEQAIWEAIKKARSAFDSERISEGWQILQSTYQAYGESETLKQAVSELEARRQSIARNRVQQAVQQARTVLLKGEYQQAINILRQATDFITFIPADLQAEWKRLGNEAAANLTAQNNRPTSPAKEDAVFSVAAAPAPAPALARRRAARRWVAAGTAGLTTIALAYVAWVRHSPPPRPVPPQALSYVEINAVPWGTVERVVPEQGEPITIHEQTPVRVMVPVGHITVVLKDPQGNELSQQCAISSDSHSCIAHFSIPPIEEIVRNAK